MAQPTQVLDFNFNATETIRTFLDAQNIPWFIAKDLVNTLGLSDVSKAMERLDDDEKLTRKLFVSGQHRDTWIVNESGLYNLIFSSRKDEAKLFRKWVTSVVLPEIRSKGTFGESDVFGKEERIQSQLKQIDNLKEKHKNADDLRKKYKSQLDKANNELHEILKTAPNQLILQLK